MAGRIINSVTAEIIQGKPCLPLQNAEGEIFSPTKVVAYQFQEIHYDASAGHSHFVYPCYFSFIGTSFLWLQVSQFPWTVQGWPHRLLMSLSSFLSCASSRELKGISSLRELGVEDKGSFFPVAGSCMTA